MMNFQKMMEQAQKMQFKLQEMQEKLADVTVIGESGGGAVKIEMTCKGEAVDMSIGEEALQEDIETLEDLVLAAINSANSAKEDKIKEETKKMLEELGLPEGTNLPMGGGAGV